MTRMTSPFSGCSPSRRVPLRWRRMPPAPVFKFAVSGDSRNCGDIVMPAIAASVLKSGANFYWHLGDFRAIYDFDEDMAPPASLGLNAPHLTIATICKSLARFHLPSASAVRESRSFPWHGEPRNHLSEDPRGVDPAIRQLSDTRRDCAHSGNTIKIRPAARVLISTGS